MNRYHLDFAYCLAVTSIVLYAIYKGYNINLNNRIFINK